MVAASFKKLQIVGTPEQVRARIEEIATRTQADEVMVSTHAYDPTARIRSYELVAQAFGLANPTPLRSEPQAIHI
jgi:alkanesulfonate monooxygenase SsuD/methylene tetrahydromethanopterin reductase-like flavin-dependent oxidoreductase (luciferase family)